MYLVVRLSTRASYFSKKDTYAAFCATDYRTKAPCSGHELRSPSAVLRDRLRFSLHQVPQLGALSHPFFGWEGNSTKIDRKKSGTLILSSTGGPSQARCRCLLPRLQGPRRSRRGSLDRRHGRAGEGLPSSAPAPF